MPYRLPALAAAVSGYSPRDIRRWHLYSRLLRLQPLAMIRSLSRGVQRPRIQRSYLARLDRLRRLLWLPHRVRSIPSIPLLAPRPLPPTCPHLQLLCLGHLRRSSAVKRVLLKCRRSRSTHRRRGLGDRLRGLRRRRLAVTSLPVATAASRLLEEGLRCAGEELMMMMAIGRNAIDHRPLTDLLWSSKCIAISRFAEPSVC